MCMTGLCTGVNIGVSYRTTGRNLIVALLVLSDEML